MNRIQKHLGLLVMLAIVFFVVIGCASMTGTTMTTKQQASVWLDIYNAQYDDTMSIMTSATSTPAQKEIGLKKKTILTRIWPLLKTYVALVDGGGAPTTTETAAITDLINQLAALAY